MDPHVWFGDHPQVLLPQCPAPHIPTASLPRLQVWSLPHRVHATSAPGALCTVKPSCCKLFLPRVLQPGTVWRSGLGAGVVHPAQVMVGGLGGYQRIHNFHKWKSPISFFPEEKGLRPPPPSPCSPATGPPPSDTSLPRAASSLGSRGGVCPVP